MTDLEGESPDSSLGPLKILDLSRVLAGPFATMMLADFGAEVTKVERPGGGDETRSWGPPYDERGEATYFQSVNRNKRSVVIDMSTEEGLAELRRRAREADVLVENFRPGLMASKGLDFETLRAENPRLVYCSVTGFGSGGGAELPGYDLLIQALGGLMSITGEPEGEPMKAGVALVDVLAGLYAAIGILVALRARDATGEGQLVEVDLLSALLASLVNQGSAYTVAGVVPGRLGNRHPSISPYEVYDTAAGELVLAVGNDRQFAALCEELGAPGLATDPRFATNPARVEHREALGTELGRLLAARPAAEWAEALLARRVPAGQVNDLGAAFAFAERLGLDPTVAVPREDGSTVSLTRNPIRLSATPATYRSAPPELPDG
ncbi:MAG TPA: CoA transferase [Solirubrobacterales bacterium]|jgi:crotonobetainyl-CoA:carnitine CoA-transferase CaiB-like acyl-CoA transferase|nr:CoA transferase [Solirubrobacterales bacterium]